jgi:hypothetical protein
MPSNGLLEPYYLNFTFVQQWQTSLLEFFSLGLIKATVYSM